MTDVPVNFSSFLLEHLLSHGIDDNSSTRDVHPGSRFLEEISNVLNKSKSKPEVTALGAITPTLVLWGEGYLLLTIILIGAFANLFSVLVIRSRELNLIHNFSVLLQTQAAFDFLYLLGNVPAFVIPALYSEEIVAKYLFMAPYFLPVIHMMLSGSAFTTVALAMERLGALQIPSQVSHRSHHRPRTQPCPNSPMNMRYFSCRVKWVILAIVLLSVVLNSPREAPLIQFFEMELKYHNVTSLHRVNNTGFSFLDLAVVYSQLPHLAPRKVWDTDYFLYYNQLFTFATMVFLPSTLLIILNTLIYNRLRCFQQVSVRLGREERRTVRATVSLIAIVFLFLVCHCVKVFINAYQLVQSFHRGEMVYTWPLWVEHLTIISHVLLGFNSSINLLLYCLCDKHFWVIAQKKLKMWFIWPLTLRSEFVSLDSVTAANNYKTNTTIVQTTEL